MYFIWMLRIVAMIFKYVSGIFNVSEACFRLFQLLYLDDSKVDRVLHLFSPPSAASSLSALAGHSIRHRG
jgi:hypothetical protein